MNNECKSCGHIFLETESKCPYCGSSNPDFKQSKPSADDFIKRAEDMFPPNNSWSNNQSNNNNDSELNVCLLIFLVIVFWPGAIIYAVVKSSKK